MKRTQGWDALRHHPRAVRPRLDLKLRIGKSQLVVLTSLFYWNRMLFYKHNLDYHPLSDFWKPHQLDAKIFQPWKKAIFSKSASAPVVMFTLLQFLRVGLESEGDVAEFGVWQGGSAGLLASASIGLNKELHLFDTFDGIPIVSDKDNFWRVGDFGRSSTSFEKVKADFSEMDFVKIHKGNFDATLNDVQDHKFCFVHVDCDVYDSVKSVTEFIYPRMSKGGVIVYDDYGDWISQGAKLAVDEFYSNIGKVFIYLPTRQAVVLC